MTHDIDLTSPQWTALVFEGKNKEYGAYEMRNDSSDRHLKALIIIVIVGLAAIYLPNLIKTDASKEVVAVSRTTEVDMSAFAKDETTIEKIEPVLPLVLLRPMDRFVPPVVVPDPEVTEWMTTQVELTESNGGIGAVAVTGVEGGTVEIFYDPPTPTAAPPKEEIPTFVEQMPQFPGGEKEMMSWLSSHIQYPPIAVEKGIYGRVVLRFVVRSDGSIDGVTVVKSLDPSCDKEAIRAVKSMPKWIPGRQNGNPVSVYYNIPVQFKLQVQ